jgi:hypothetical protein
MVYQIKVKGKLDQNWSAWLGSAKITTSIERDGTEVTTLTLTAIDQSTLFGILDRIRDLNISLVSVTRDGEEI